MNDGLEGFAANAKLSPFTRPSCSGASISSIFPLDLGEQAPALVGLADGDQGSAIFSLKGDGQGGFQPAICSIADFPTTLGSVSSIITQTPQAISGPLPNRSSSFQPHFVAAGKFRNALHGNDGAELAAQGLLTTREWRSGACAPTPTTSPLQTNRPAGPSSSRRDCPPATSAFACPNLGGQQIECPAGTTPECDGLLFGSSCIDGACTCRECSDSSVTIPIMPPPPNACLTERHYPPLIVTFASRCGDQ